MSISKQQAMRWAKKIIEILYPHRRLLDTEYTCQHDDITDCFNIHRDKLLHYLMTEQIIEFVLPAFPAKSPNTNKTFSELPDLGERLALRFLQDICRQIKLVYPLGAKIIICSDGRVFNDLVRVCDDHVNRYTQEINRIISEENLTQLSSYGLDNHYMDMPYETMRQRLTVEYGESIEELKARVKMNAADKALFNGIHRFIFEDYTALYSSLSRNQLRNLTKGVAYLVIQRSNAWGRFIDKIFPHAVRLSIHPQPCYSTKFGIMLLKSHDVWATPWHRVLMIKDEEAVLIRKVDAEKMGAKPIFHANQFSHYIHGG